MGFLDKLTELVPSAKEIAEKLPTGASKLIDDAGGVLSSVVGNKTKTNEDRNINITNENTSVKLGMKSPAITSKKEIVVQCDKENLTDGEKANTMLKIMDWAYDKANGNLPGLGTSKEMAESYLNKFHGDVSKAVDSLICWQATYAGTAGFLSSMGGFTTIVVSLPANIASVMAIQLRMIGAISYMTEEEMLDEERKTSSYLCLLGAEAANVLANVGSEFAVKFSTHALKNVSGAVLSKINKAVGFRLFTKFGEKGLINIHKFIPILGGIVGASIDALSTYTMAQAAKAIFLKDLLDKEKADDIEVLRFKILVNMALVDGIYTRDEKLVLESLSSSLDISNEKMKVVEALIEHPSKSEIDWSPYKGDVMLSACLMETLNSVVMADGKCSMAEKIYFKQIGKELGYSEDDLKSIIG